MSWQKVNLECTKKKKKKKKKVIEKTYCILAQRRLRELKTKISTQSKKNFMRERDVRFLDARIGLLIQNRMALEEVIGHKALVFN
jgi:hypothetical protein